MTVLNYEAYQIVNNLKMTEVRGEYELQEFRTELLSAIDKLKITEQEKEIFNRIQDLKSKNLMWKSLSSALNPTMLITGGKSGPQIAFQAMVTAARTAVDYQATKGENEIEEIQAMWDLKKTQITAINNFRLKALNITQSLYNKYTFLGEFDRLTEETATQFIDIISEPNSSKRARLLKEKENVYKMIPEYYYHLGMAQLGDDPEGKDANYDSARPYLDKYLELYAKTPIFRYDQKSGIVALTKLAYEPSLSSSKKEELINIALSNLNNNGAAILQCALVYILDLGQPQKGFDLLRSGLDNNCTNTGAILSTISYYIDEIKKYPSTYKDVLASIDYCKTIALNEYIPFKIASEKDAWSSISNIISIEKGPNINIKLDRYFDCKDITVYKVDYSGKDGKIRQQDLIPEKSFTIENLKKRLDVFNEKGNENLIFAFFDPVILGTRYSVKRNLDNNNIRNREFPGAVNYNNVDDKALNSIIEFCDKNKRQGIGMRINLSNSKETVKQKEKYSLLDQYYYNSVNTISKITSTEALENSNYSIVIDYFGKDSLKFIPAKLESITGNFIVIDFGDISHTIVTYKEEGASWSPFSIERNGTVIFYTPQDVLNPEREGRVVQVWNGAKTMASDGAERVTKAVNEATDWIKDKFKKSDESGDTKQEKVPSQTAPQEEKKSTLDKLKFWKK
ncbi:MAG: hypothetical protein MJY72_04140 [Bacteroidales bacterium]|nr:hypothetical protein [Bacteroidales bacterium]